MLHVDKDKQERYNRNILVQEIGLSGQIKLLQSKVLIIGAGGLGSASALYLAAAGVGTIGLADADMVDMTNLQRQILHTTADIGRPKVVSGNNKITALNPDITVHAHQLFVNAASVMKLIYEYDFIIEATDNFAAKFLINDACVMTNKPFSHAGVIRFSGQTITILPHVSACYRCIFQTLPSKSAVPNSSETGIVGSIAGMLGTIQATEAIKFITGAGSILANTLLTIDALEMDFRKIKIKRNSACAVCGDNPSICEPVDEKQPV